MLRHKLMFVTLALVCASIFATSSHAVVFEGQVIRMSHEAPSFGVLYTGPQDAVVGPGVEGNFYPPYTIDVSDTSILIDFAQNSTWGAASFNGIRIFDLNGTVPSLTSVTLTATNMPGFDQARIIFDSDNVWLNFQSLPWNSSHFIVVSVQAVPEPSTYINFLAGMALIFLLRRRLVVGNK